MNHWISCIQMFAGADKIEERRVPARFDEARASIAMKSRVSQPLASLTLHWLP